MRLCVERDIDVSRTTVRRARTVLVRISGGQCRYCILRISFSSHELCPLAPNCHPPPHPLRGTYKSSFNLFVCDVRNNYRYARAHCFAVRRRFARECQCSSASLAAWIFNFVVVGAARYLFVGHRLDHCYRFACVRASECLCSGMIVRPCI